MAFSKPIASPMLSSLVLSYQDLVPFDRSSFYRSMISALQYITFTQPNITYVVNKCCESIRVILDCCKMCLALFTRNNQSWCSFQAFISISANWFFQMQTRVLALMIESLAQWYMFFLAPILLYGVQKSNQLSPSQALKHMVQY